LKPIKTLTTHLHNQTSSIFGRALCSLIGSKGKRWKRNCVCVQNRENPLWKACCILHFQSFGCEYDLLLRGIVFMDPRHKKFAMLKSWKREKSLVKELVRGMYERIKQIQLIVVAAILRKIVRMKKMGLSNH
jgi:hypothetical protein